MDICINAKKDREEWPFKMTFHFAISKGRLIEVKNSARNSITFQLVKKNNMPKPFTETYLIDKRKMYSFDYGGRGD